jgi:hypothetical protein
MRNFLLVMAALCCSASGAMAAQDCTLIPPDADHLIERVNCLVKNDKEFQSTLTGFIQIQNLKSECLSFNSSSLPPPAAVVVSCQLANGQDTSHSWHLVPVP